MANRTTLLTALVILATSGLQRSVVAAQRAPFPVCLASVCLDEAHQPSEKQLRSRFGGSRTAAAGHGIVYCYRFVTPSDISYGRFVLDDLRTGVRVVTVGVSASPLCERHTDVRLKRPPATAEGIALGSAEMDVRMKYGPPSFETRGNDSQLLFTKGPDDDLASARFLFSAGRVRSIELSVDE